MQLPQRLLSEKVPGNAPAARSMRGRGAVTALVVLLNACSGPGASFEPAVITVPATSSTSTTSTTLPDLAPLQGLTLDLVADGLDEPVAIASSPSTGMTFVVERTGKVRSLTTEPPEVVLDITERVGWDISEQGFLGFILHPDFPNDPRAFAIYTNLKKDVVVSSFAWTESARFDPTSEIEIFQVEQQQHHHQGGGMVFGPEGYLWMSFGDGGGNGDRYHHGQNVNTLRGTVVRINIDGPGPYSIPSTNPFALTDDGAGEIWAYGLRNPWRITIDRDLLFIADVAFNGSEEVNVSRVDDSGLNFGWPVMEGAECYDSETCDSSGMTPPVLTVPHTGACAIIGGPVYRGFDIPELHGHYVFGDYCFGWMRSAPVNDGGLGEVVDWEPMLGTIGNITTFGIDGEGELLVAIQEGKVFRVTALR